MNYKTNEIKGHQGQLNKSWIMNYDELESQNSDILCPLSLSNSYKQMMKNGISPLNEIKNKFDEDFPIFDNTFFHCLDHFVENYNNEGIELLEFLLYKNIKNAANFYGKHSINIILSNLPTTFQALSYLLSVPLSLMASETFYSIDWISFLQPFIENEEFHLILSTILQSIEPLKIAKNILPQFFDMCEKLLNSPNKEVIVNILFGFQDRFFYNYKQEIATTLMRNFKNLINEDQDDVNIIQFLLLSFSKILNDETVKIVINDDDLLFNFLADSLSSSNEKILFAASDLTSSLVSFPQALKFFSSNEIIDKIFELANESLFSVRKNMVLTLCDLIKQQSTEKNLDFLSKNILDLLIEFIETDQNDGTLEVVEGILYLIESIEETDQITNVIDVINENKYSFIQLDERGIEDISRIVKRILDSAQNSAMQYL